MIHLDGKRPRRSSLHCIANGSYVGNGWCGIGGGRSGWGLVVGGRGKLRVLSLFSWVLVMLAGCYLKVISEENDWWWCYIRDDAAAVSLVSYLEAMVVNYNLATITYLWMIK